MTGRTRQLAIATIALALLSIAADASALLRMDGIGPVKLGMTVRAAERALGARLRVDNNPDGSGPVGCAYATLASGRNPEINYMLDDGRIVRIDIDDYRSRLRHPSTVTTEAGIGIGASEDDLRHAYGSRLKFDAHPYIGDEGHYITLEDRGGRRGLLFETDHGKVTAFRNGGHPYLDWIEGCS